MKTNYKLSFTLLVILLTSISLFASNSGDNKLPSPDDGTSIAIVTGVSSDSKNVTFLNPVTNANGTYKTGTFNGTINGSPANFYCIDLGHNIQWNVPYNDQGSTSSEITYVLNNYFPYVSYPYAGSAANIKDEAAAVQCAIWHFSDGLDLNTITNGTIKNRALAIAADADANHNNILPVQTLDILPVADTLNPEGTTVSFIIEVFDENNVPAPDIDVTISTSSDGVLSTTNVTTDVNGQSPVVTLTHASDNVATITASATVTIPQGTRYFHSTDPNGKQKLVLATPEVDTKEVQKVYKWVPNIDLELTKTVSDETIEDGDNITFTLTVINPSDHNAENVIVYDPLPDGFDFVSASSANYDEVTGKWTVGTVAGNSSESLDIVVTVDYASVNAAPYNLGPVADFNLFVLRDLTQPSADTEGKVAVGRNAELDNYSIGALLPNSGGTEDVFVVGRKVKWESGAVYGGNVVYGRFNALNEGRVSITDGTIRQDTVVDFNAAADYLNNLSALLSNYTENGTTTFEWGQVKCVGTNPLLNVFTVDGDDLTAANDFLIDVPNASVVLINVEGNNIEWTGGLNVVGTDFTNVLFNFNQATNIKIVAIDVTGTILAPKATVNFVSGVQNGQMIAKNVIGQGQFNNKLFVGNIPVDPILPNSAEITAMDGFDTNANNNTATASVYVDLGNNPNNGGNGNGGNNQNVNWQAVGQIASNQVIWTMTEDLNGDLVAGTWGGLVMRSDDNGATWDTLNTSMNVAYVWDVAIDGNGVIYAGTELGLYKSDDDGATWSATSLTGIDVRSVVVDPADNDVLYAGTWGYGVYKSVDAAANWTEVNTDLVGNAVHSLVFTSTGDLYAGTFQLGIYRLDGNAWVNVDCGYDHIWDLAVNSNDHIYAATYGGGVLYSADGTSWSDASAGLGNSYIYNVRVDGNDDVYVATWMSGVYKLNVNPVGNAPVGGWSNLGLNGYQVSSIFVNSDDNKLYAATEDGTLFVGDAITGVEENEVDGPVNYALNQNYPNPFNPSTVISFSVQNDGFYSLKVFNVLGQEVATLIDRNLATGEYNVDFNASGLASGLYIYKLEGNDVNLVRKMMLMK